MNKKQALGRKGEDWVIQYLQRKGWSIIEQNWRCRFGEADVIAWDGHTCVVIEVRTRSSKTDYGHPLESITMIKRNRLMKILQQYVKTLYEQPHDIRVDVVALVLKEGFDSPSEVEHIQHI